MDISEKDITAYETNGVVHVPNAFSLDWIEKLRKATEAEMADPGPMVLDLERGKKGRFFGNTFIWHHREAFKDFIFNSPAAEIAAKILRSKKVNVLFDQLLVKEPGTETETMWHHDQPYWPVWGDQVLTMWIALDPVTPDSGAVEYIAGSHRWGKRFKAKSFTGDDRYKEDLPELPDIEAERDQHTILQPSLAVGDCTLHQGLTVHHAPGNSRSDVRRRGYVIRWCGDDATYYPRPNIQPMLRDPEIPSGGPLDSDLFPVVWREREMA